MRKLIILLTALFLSITGFSQQWGSDLPPEIPPPKDGPRKPGHEKRTFQDTDNKIYWQVSLPAYINISTSEKMDGEAYRMKTVRVESMKEHSNPMYFDGHGEHFIRHYDYHNGIPEKEVAFKVYVDGIAPKTEAFFMGAERFVKDGTTYYGKGLTGELAAKDEMSGVDQILQSVNGLDYKTYSQKNTFSEEKTYVWMYYAVDRVGNAEADHAMKFIVDLTAPESSHEISGKRLDNIFSSKVNVALSSLDKLSGVKVINWSIDNGNLNRYTKKIYVKSLKDGEHTITYRATDQVANEEETQTISFYLDKIAPVVKAEIIGDVFRKNGTAYISERSEISLSATDNKAGVESIFYSLDGTASKTYDKPFKIDASQGVHMVKYKGLDKVDNMGALVTNDDLGKLFLDLTPPTINHEYIGPSFRTRDTIFITSETKVKLSAVDHQSGLKVLNYDLGKSEQEFTDPFTVEKDGLHDVKYYALDQVNNRKDNDFFFIVDNIGPELFHHFSMQPIGTARLDEEEGGDIPIYSPHNLPYLAATDNAVGTQNIYYSLDETTEKLYGGPIRGLRKGYHSLKIRAVDYLGNETTSELIHFMMK